mmetsp:Transcript_11235/g.27022  ORF Transcript_11235/g.27022 Transcript_11235/m.27022 type:complete len:100 (-) Transcript_11235:618-917(-)
MIILIAYCVFLPKSTSAEEDTCQNCCTSLPSFQEYLGPIPLAERLLGDFEVTKQDWDVAWHMTHRLPDEQPVDANQSTSRRHYYYRTVGDTPRRFQESW